MKIKLKDGTTYSCNESSTSKLVLLVYDSSTIMGIVEKMTKDNLSEFNYLDDSDNVIGIYADKEVSKWYVENELLTFELQDVDAVSEKISESEKDRKSLQEQIDDINTIVIPSIMEIIDTLMNGGEV